MVKSNKEYDALNNEIDNMKKAISESETILLSEEEEKRLVIRDYDPEQSEYKEGRVYIDFITKKAFVKQGQYLIPYEDYISETVSTG